MGFVVQGTRWDLTFPVPVTQFTVSTAQQLQSAVQSAVAAGGNSTIYLNDGTYVLSDALYLNAPGITLRSTSGNRANVIIKGDAISGSASVPFNVRITQPNWIIRDITLGGYCAFSALQLEGGCDNGLLSNCILQDSFEHLIKASVLNNVTGTTGIIVEDCLFRFLSGAAPAQYNGGIDCHRGTNWIIRRNTFRDIESPISTPCQHAVNFWNGSTGNTIERNVVIDCDRGIGDGLLGYPSNDNNLIMNNMVYHSNNGAPAADVGISVENATNSRVYNNTVFLQTSLINWALEYRYTTTGAEFRNNLSNQQILSRNGGTATLSNNVTSAQSTWFTNLSTGDLTLNQSVSGVVDAGVTLAVVTVDQGGQARPQGSAYDIGADEYGGSGSDPLSLPLFTSAGISYLGSFVQPTTGGYYDMQHGMGMDTTDATGGRMYVGARNAPDANFMSLSRINIPNPPYTGQAATESIAKVNVPFDVSGGDSNGTRLGNTLVVSPTKIVVNSYAYYYNNGDQPKAIASASLSMTGWTTAQSFSVGNRPFSSFMAHVPSVWQSLLGGPHVVGSSAMSIISNAACGVNLAVGDLNQVGTGGPATITMTPLAQFTFPTVMGSSDGNHVVDGAPAPYFNARTHIGGVGFIANTRTLMSIGSHGTGTQAYLQSPSSDPCTGYGGVSAWPYIFQYQLFDVADYVKVKNGQMAASAVKPYAYGVLPGPTGNCRLSQPGSGCYDPVRKRFYLAEQFGGVVHVWQIT